MSNNTANPTAPWYLDAVAAKSLILDTDYGVSSTSWTKDTLLYKKLLLATKYQREICIGSPAYLQVFDSNNNMTGYSGSVIKDQISNVVYDTQDYEAASIIIPVGEYKYRVVGTETGTYRFAIIDINGGVEKVIRVVDIPTTKNQVHEYGVDWANLTLNTGVTVRIDVNGDGKFDKTITGGSTLTASDFSKVGENNSDKGAICHRPPGNPGNSHTLFLPASAILAHLAHGDKKGECEKGDKDDDDKDGKDGKENDKKGEKDEDDGKDKEKEDEKKDERKEDKKKVDEKSVKIPPGQSKKKK